MTTTLEMENNEKYATENFRYHKLTATTTTKRERENLCFSCRFGRKSPSLASSLSLSLLPGLNMRTTQSEAVKLIETDFVLFLLRNSSPAQLYCLPFVAQSKG